MPWGGVGWDGMMGWDDVMRCRVGGVGKDRVRQSWGKGKVIGVRDRVRQSWAEWGVPRPGTGMVWGSVR